MSDHILSKSAYKAVIHAPIQHVDIADWLMTLPDAEYQRCAPPDHIACGSTTGDDGRKMSINVEQIGEGLVIQHYVAEVLEPHHCRMVSHSDVYSPHGRSKVQVIWDLSVKAIDAGSCEYTNDVTGLTTPEFMTFIKTHGITVEQAAAARQAASSNHNSRETPLFAKSIERNALVRKSALTGNSNGKTALSPREVARVFTPKLASLIERPLFSDVWTDRDLGLRERSIATIAVLVANGNLAELATHLRRAHDGGMTCAEISALITHTAFYAGFPAAVAASGVAAEILGACKDHPAPSASE